MGRIYIHLLMALAASLAPSAARCAESLTRIDVALRPPYVVLPVSEATRRPPPGALKRPLSRGARPLRVVGSGESRLGSTIFSSTHHSRQSLPGNVTDKAATRRSIGW
jgi:hypothetical protein